MKVLTAVLVTAALAACTPSRAPQDARGADSAPTPPPPVAAPTSAPGAAAPADTGSIARLEREARALAHADGCAADGCRTAPVGSRPCGGPREYIVYCAATTDSAALFAKLAELARAEEAFNSASGMISTCEFRNPPNVAVQGGRCVATPSEGLTAQ
ncbi:MAG TPA: hypothetical protein VGO40_11165 [Longimicrobium sp.]|jgi:hypothetical protein|nr:hypothetical protein [Longimicrobium sp.]